MKEKEAADLEGLSVDPRDYGVHGDGEREGGEREGRGPGRSGYDSEVTDSGAPGSAGPMEAAEPGAEAELSTLSGEEIVAAIQRNISCIAYCHARVIDLIDEADRRGLWAQWVGVKSLPQWVMHIASVTMHTAREYVRVMTALRQMPKVRQSLAEGDVSYSKVREVTRLGERIGDEEALRLATVATGSQISRISQNYQQLAASTETADIPRLLPSDTLSFRPNGPGRIRITIDLGEDEAGELNTMLEAARQAIEAETREDSSVEDADEDADEDAADSSDSVPDIFEEDWSKARDNDGAEDKPRYEPISQVMCLMRVVRAFPRAESEGVVDADRARMLVHASAEVVTRAGAALEAAESSPEIPLDDSGAGDSGAVDSGEYSGAEDSGAESSGAEADENVPVGTSADATCRIEGFGGIASATAERLSCEALISGTIKAADGDVLMLGRSKRLVSKRQRLALSARDIGCQFPGCRARRRCDAHHIRPWSAGGTTDMGNLVLLCRAHHTAVHMFQLRIERTGAPFAGALQAPPAFAFFLPDGSELLPLEKGQIGRQVLGTARLVEVAKRATSEADPFTVGGGYGFDLDLCIAWMFEAEWRHARGNDVAA
ncbi:HNH endonuclease signature motif containing protein [Brevibacterium sp. GP-SGM9]|uniref:HNH endonuclease signature motif containing protein n=1 Tax=Brevibacterium sp. GP-SGM9 TaxID=3376990 RepID=UPI0039A718D8